MTPLLRSRSPKMLQDTRRPMGMRIEQQPLVLSLMLLGGRCLEASKFYKPYKPHTAYIPHWGPWRYKVYKLYMLYKLYRPRWDASRAQGGGLYSLPSLKMAL